MSRNMRRSVPVFLSIGAGICSLMVSLSGQSSPSGKPSTANGEWPHYTADIRGSALFAARSDQRVELQQARGRVALQDRQPRPASRVQARRHAADGQRRALHDRRHAAVGRRARREDRRADLGAQPARRQARRRSRRASCRAAACRTGPTARATSASSTSRPAIGWSRSNAKTGAPIAVVRQGRHRRSEGRRRSTATGSRSISRPARSACTRRRRSSATW